MARGVNKVILVGYCGKDPEVRYSQSGNAITSVSVATTESWKDRNEQKQERTEWHRVKFFGRLAEIAGEYLKKGTLVYVEGSLRTEKFTDKQGVEKYSTDIVANEMQMLGGGSGGSGERSEGHGATERAPARSEPSGDAPRGYGGGGGSSPPSGGDEPFPDGDIPFVSAYSIW